MDDPTNSKRKFKSLVESVKRINDDPNVLVETTFDRYRDDLLIGDGVVKKSINDFKSKIKGRTQNRKNIFRDILDTTDAFLGTETEDLANNRDYPIIKSKTLRYASKAAQKALLTARQTITDQVKQAYFSGQGTCNPNTEIGASGYTISPKEFDVVNMLKINPESIAGQLMYEIQPDPGLGLQFNRKLFEYFDLPGGETVYTRDGTVLFSIEWNSSIQKYEITNLDTNLKVASFLDDYYNTIEIPNIENVLKNAMMLMLQGDGSEPNIFDEGIISFNRLISKMFSICGHPDKGDSPFLNNTPQQLNEDEVDIQDYFNFDDVEGVDLDEEDRRRRRVLKFTDCDNFEIPINNNHIEDFTYLTKTQTLDNVIDNTLIKIANDAYEESEYSTYFEGFQLSIITDYILEIPRALIANILSPKLIFPIALVNDMLYAEYLDVKALMKKMSNLFFKIIRDMFWTFIKEFWKYVKKDLLIFVRQTATTIINNQLKKIKSIVLSLINLLLRVLETDIKSCAEIFNALLRVIQAALNRSVKIPIPGLLLVLAEGLPGFSADRTFIDAIERMENAGINTGPIYGTENKLPYYVKSVIDAYASEMDSNSYVKIALKPTVIPAGPGGAVISPLVTGTGKVF